jgi:VIT1/CCC1 family predicted Fe2+/Mn2+ transporter
MGLIEFFVYVIVVVLAAAAAQWVIATYAPGTPEIIKKSVWALAAVLVLVMLAHALGLWGYDPQIPRLR